MYDCFEREVHCLRLIDCFEWSPGLIECDRKSETFLMTYCGDRITKENAPSDWKEQMQKILLDMESIGLNHNDIKPEEVLVKDEKLYLCDWGWSSLGDDCSFGGRFNPPPLWHTSSFFSPDAGSIKRIEDAIK